MQLNSDRPIPAEAVRSLYDAVGWWPDRQVDDLAAVLNGGLAVGAWDGDRLIGFARIVSDGKFRAFIEDVCVHPDHRRTGTGTQLLDVLLQAIAHIETITLFCAPELVPFYEAHNFRAKRSQIVLHRTRNS